MTLTNTQLFTFIGIAPAARRNAIIDDFLSEGLEGLALMTDEDVRDTCASYAKRQDAPFPIILTPILKQRLRSIVLWVKDQKRINQAPTFRNGIGQAEVKQQLTEAMERELRRKTQKKEGENYLDSTFNSKLKSTAQWEKWSEELESTLCQIIGVRGVPLSYVIRKNDDSEFEPDVPFDDIVINAVTLDGIEYRQDARTVHKIITKNIHEDSDAYTYVKPMNRHRDGRRDILALRERYSSDATRQNIINRAKSELLTLRYKNERSFSFERFSAKLQKGYDDLEDQGRAVNNGDIVDDLWDRIQAPELQMYLASLKVDYQRNPHTYRSILQDIAAEAGKSISKSATFTRNVSAAYTRKGDCPKQGVHTTDGSIFIGSYEKEKWQSEQVRQYHQEIAKARAADGGGKNTGGKDAKSQKRRTHAIKRDNKKLKTLKAKIAAAKLTLKKTSETKSDDHTDEESDDHAGDAFGLGKQGRRGEGRHLGSGVATLGGPAGHFAQVEGAQAMRCAGVLGHFAE